MSNLYVANTDFEWFAFLAAQGPLDEVNFWQPGGKTQFRVLRPGELFLFKLKAPHQKIAGYGVFVESSLLPLSLAWQTFGIKNGHPTFESFSQSIRRYKRDDGDMIGFRVIAQPVFWPKDAWFELPAGWPRQAVGGKSYAIETHEGRSLWKALQDRTAVNLVPAAHAPGGFGEAPAPMFGTPYAVQPRLGQGGFRIGVIEAYSKRCIVTGERTIPALDAAHIIPVSESGTHDLTNGLLLRRDIHALFDLHYVTITPDKRFEVSRRIREEFENGRHYYALHGARVAEPNDPRKAPAPEALRRHNARFVP